ncbi:aminoglycoside phosphotransferase family protein [Ornithinimicrobium panacihumi]|uniref:aminoglycoside phosphotransferase family protein n=1 Tax=Ornithinimicrobium panacihumi TaxID=2008449 RepID=UPI003F8B9172
MTGQFDASGSDEVEVPLAGGDVTEGVVRVGRTVRRPLGVHSPLVHRVLTHLEEAGFEGAPRLLGVDDRGREVLTFVEGEVAGRPWPAWVGEDERAVSVARLVRRVDDALEPLGVRHMDVTPENTVFREGQAFALIDFDLVREATRLEQVANLLLWWGAWLPEADRDPVQRHLDAAARGRLLVDAYGLDRSGRERLLQVAIEGADRTWHRMKSRAEQEGGGWARMWREGAGDQIRRRERWLQAHQRELTGALVRR